MKTPREILLRKHAGAQPKLERLREQTMATLSHGENAARRQGFFALLREALTLPRTAWAVLGLAWLGIIGLNVAARGDAARQPLTVARHTPASRQALAEQRRFYTELVRSPMPADVPTFVPRPRSDCRLQMRIA